MSEFANPPSYRTAVARRSPLGFGWKLLIGCALWLAIAAAAFVGWAYYLGTRGLPEGIDVEVEAPATLRLGDTFELVARIANHDDRGHSLIDLDVADSLLGGIKLGASTPPFAEALHVPLTNVRSHTYDLAVPARRTVEVRFAAFAADTGEHVGHFTFCVDSKAQCGSYPVRLVVLPPAARPADEAEPADGGA